MRIPDLIEQKEMAAEERYLEQTRGLPEGQFRCDCGEVDDESNAMPADSTPWAPMMCGACYERAVAETEAA